MAVTGAEAQKSDQKNDQKNESGGGGRRRTRGDDRPRTTLDEHVDKPSVVEPGDAPFDTTDPTERAISVEPDKAAAAAAGFQTVNAVIPKPEVEQEEEPERKHRTEKYKALAPNGKLVDVERDLETGETKVS